MRTVARSLSRLVTLATLIALSAPATAQESGPVQLRLRLESGMTYRMLTTMEMDVTQSVMGQEQQSYQRNEGVALTEVLSVDENGVARVRSTQESVRVVQDGPMGRTEYDSTDPESVATQQVLPLTMMLGESLTMDMAPNGAISGVEGMEDLLPRFLEEMELPPGPVRDQMEETFGDQFGADPMAEMMQQAVAGLPDDPVAIGDSWSRSVSIENPVPLDMEMTWTLRDRRDGVAYLDMKSVRVSKGSKQMGPMIMVYDTSGETNGTVEIDEATGLTLRMSWEGESTGTVTMNSPTGDMVMPMTTVEKFSVELLSRN